MKRFESFKNLIQNKPMFENISGAKALMFKKYAELKRIDPAQMTEEDKRDALNRQEYRDLIATIGNNHGYAVAFLKFHLIHRVPYSELKNLLEILTSDANIARSLRMTVDQYANEKEVNGVNPFEALMDDIHSIELRRASKWIIDALPGNLRRAIKEMPAEEQQRLLNAAKIMNDLGQEVKDRLLKKARAFSDPMDFIEYAENYVKGYSNSDITSKMEKIEELEPEAGVLYADDRYLMLSARTEKAQKDLCSVANWCINRGSFNNSSYGGGAIQINTFDFTKPPTDPLHLVGTTISYDGRVTYSHDINDTNKKFTDNIEEHFRRYGYPEQMIKVLKATLPIETVIKKVVTSLQLDRKGPIEVLEDIIKSSYTVNTENNESATNVIMSILMDRIAPAIRRDDIIARYLKLGVLSQFSARLFTTLITDLTPEEKANQIAKNEEIYSFLKGVVRKQGAPSVSPALKNVLDAEDSVMQTLRGINENLVMAEPSTKPTIAPPTTRPSTPSRPSPIPTKRPAVNPQPKAEAEDVIKRFYREAEAAGINIETLLK